MIVVDHVSKYYGSRPAVRDLDFRIEEGECVGFLGLNGAGKSTTLRLLSCLLLPTSGRVRIRGLDVEDDPHEVRKLLGFLPDTPPLYPEMRVSDFLRFAGRLRAMDGKAVEARLPEVYDLCGLEEVRDQPIATLSHGYRQRVGIAQAIVHRPPLLILDEPINGLDPVQIVEMREMIRGLRGAHTILLSTHILSEIEQTCDRILMLHQGRIAAQGTEEEIVARFGGGSGVLLELRAGGAYRGPDEVKTLLGAVDGVTGVSVSPSGASWVVRVRTSRDVRDALARAVVEAGLGLLRLEQEDTGLERIFVDLSRDGAGPAATADGAPEATP